MMIRAKVWMTGIVTAALSVPHCYGATTQVIEYYGDSTIWGYKSGTGGRVSKPAPTVFADMLQPRSTFDVRNEGVNGTTACELLNGTDGSHAAWPRQMQASSAKYVIVNFGINDQWKDDVNTYSSCLRSLARVAREHGKQMIFETPNPTRDSGSDGLDIYVKAMRKVAAEEGLPLIDQYHYLTEQLGGRRPEVFCPDGLHPSEAIYATKGQFAARVFMNTFGKR